MSNPAERLALLLAVHDDSLRNAAERCGLDHTTMMRVKNGETENPATLAKIAEGYGVPVAWVRGDRDLATDFVAAVVAQPLQERVMFMWEPQSRIGFTVRFLLEHSPQVYTVDHLADLLHLSCSEVKEIIDRGLGSVSARQLERVCSETSLPLDWFEAGVVGWEDEKEMLLALTIHTLSSMSVKAGANLTEEQIHEMALALTK